jgi:hypothetical protein
VDNKPRKVNQSLDQQPKLFGLPSEQIIPWIIIAGVSYYVVKVLFRLSWIWVVVVAGWGISTWWILTGSRTWRFLSKFQKNPNWIRAVVRYRGIKNEQRQHKTKDRQQRR